MATSGLCSARHSVLAATSPTSSEPASPGVLATATASKSRQLHAGAAQRLVDHRQNPLDMGPGRDLRHDPVEPFVEMVLRSHDRAQDLQRFRDHGGRRLVAGGLDRQDLPEPMRFRSRRAGHGLLSGSGFGLLGLGSGLAALGLRGSGLAGSVLAGCVAELLVAGHSNAFCSCGSTRRRLVGSGGRLLGRRLRALADHVLLAARRDQLAHLGGGQRHHIAVVRNHAPVVFLGRILEAVDVLPVGPAIAGRGQLQRAVAAFQLDHVLDAALAPRAFADDHRPFVVLETRRHDLAGAGAVAVDQHRHREAHEGPLLVRVPSCEWACCGPPC